MRSRSANAGTASASDSAAAYDRAMAGAVALFVEITGQIHGDPAAERVAGLDHADAEYSSGHRQFSGGGTHVLDRG